jgi:hypothetical protein
MDNVINKVIARVGELHLALITGDYADGKDTGIIDLVLVGDINVLPARGYVEKAEKMIGRKIRLLVLTPDEFEVNKKSLNYERSLCLWQKE